MATDDRGQLPALALPLRELSSKLVQEEFAAGLLKVLLTHAGSAFEAGEDEGWRASHDPAGVKCLRSGAAR